MKAQIPLETARAWAEWFCRKLAPSCCRIEVAGSIRRKRPMVGDVEIVCEPRFEERAIEGDLFGNVGLVDLLPGALDRAVASGAIERGTKAGERYRQYQIPELGCALDLFVVRPPATWGAILAIRTGPAMLSKDYAMCARRMRLQLREGALYRRDGSQIPTDTEEQFLAALDLRWREPEHRMPCDEV